MGSDNLTVAYINSTAVIRAEGRGSFKISPPLKQFIRQVIDDHSAEHILLDMSDCITMDSTFMGVLAGLSCYIKSKPNIDLKLINLSPKNEKSLITIGVDRVVVYSLSNTIDERNLITQSSQNEQTLDTTGSPNKLDTAKTTLEAHEALININPENYDKFKSVLEVLKTDLRNLT